MKALSVRQNRFKVIFITALYHLPVASYLTSRRSGGGQENSLKPPQDIDKASLNIIKKSTRIFQRYQFCFFLIDRLLSNDTQILLETTNFFQMARLGAIYTLLMDIIILVKPVSQLVSCFVNPFLRVEGGNGVGVILFTSFFIYLSIQFAF